MPSNLKCYHLGYYINAYAGWYKIQSFSEPVDVVRWLMNNADGIEKVDFIVFRVEWNYLD